MSLTLLRALYDPNAPLCAEDEAFNEALAEVEGFRIAPQVYYLLKQQNRLKDVPPFFLNRLQKHCNQTLMQNVFIKFETDQLLQTFDEAGIRCIPLKGIRFAEKYFGHVAARETTDIDLLVRREDVEAAVACVKQRGFQMEGKPIPSHFHCGFAKPLGGSPYPLSVEIHWDILMNQTSNFVIEPFWERAVPLQPYRYVSELSDQDAFYMICLHGWKHAMDSLKYFIDIVQMLHAAGQQIDYDMLFADASKHKTYRRMVSTLSIVYQQFPHLRQQKPLPVPMRERTWWNYDAIRKKKTDIRRYARFLQYQWFDFDTPRHSLAASFHYLQTLRIRQEGG